jgi:hypothetical protein
LKWQTFETFDYENGRLVSLGREPANPVPIPAGGAVAHDTYFTPFRKMCNPKNTECKEWVNYMVWDDFVAAIQKGNDLKFRFIAEIYGDDPVSVECFVKSDPNLVDRLRKEMFQSASCWLSE